MIEHDQSLDFRCVPAPQCNHIVAFVPFHDSAHLWPQRMSA